MTAYPPTRVVHLALRLELDIQTVELVQPCSRMCVRPRRLQLRVSLSVIRVTIQVVS